MFTGIITDIGRIRSIEPSGDPCYGIETAFDTQAIALGASIACDGVCLTVIAKGADWFKVQVSAETLRLTTIGQWKIGRRINLEQALKLGDELGGHIVSGHVDGLGRITELRPENDSLRFVISVPAELAPYIARKGSIAVDGVSLTVNAVGADYFEMNIIPHTQHHTTLGLAMAGAAVNLEIDMLARYVARQLGKDAP